MTSRPSRKPHALIAVASLLCAGAVLQPPAHSQQPFIKRLPSNVQDVFEGQVVGMDGTPVPGARVKAYAAGEEKGTALADGSGRFRVVNLASAMLSANPTPRYYFFAADAPGQMSVPVAVDPYEKTAVKIVVAPQADVKVRVVNTSGEPIAGAILEPTRFTTRYSDGQQVNVNWRAEPLPPFVQNLLAQRVVTDDDGMATLIGLPSYGVLELWLRHSSYADLEHLVPLAKDNPVTLKMSLETVIEGRATLADGSLLPAGALSLKAQTWEYPYYHRTAKLNEKGYYRIEEVSSLELLGEKTLGINLTKPPGVTDLAPGIKANYLPGSYDLLVTITRKGRVEHWIAYVEAQNAGFTYREGELVHRDIILQPMAVIQGHIAPAGNGRPRVVWYNDPHTIYGPRYTTCSRDGSFEVTVPPGDVQLHFANSTLTVKGLKPQEIRPIELQTPVLRAKLETELSAN